MYAAGGADAARLTSFFKSYDAQPEPRGGYRRYATGGAESGNDKVIFSRCVTAAARGQTAVCGCTVKLFRKQCTVPVCRHSVAARDRREPRITV